MKKTVLRFLSVFLLAALTACGYMPQSPETNQLEVLTLQTTDSYAASDPHASVFPAHEPYGTGVGAKPGRVVWSYDPDSVDWDGQGYWWELDHFDEAVMQRMVDSGIASLAGAADAAAGWDALFCAHNAAHGGSGGYRQGEKIAIKVNINGAGAYGDDTKGETRESYTNPVLLKTLLVSLVSEAGAAPADITVYDAGRVVPDYVQALCGSGVLAGVQFQYRDLLGTHDAQPDRNAPVVWSQTVNGDTNYLPTCVTQADYLINFANLKGHVYGMTLTAKNHYGTIMNSSRMRAPEAAGIHRYLTQNRMNAYTVLVDLMANEQLYGKTMLYMLDAIICAPGESVSITGENSRWQQAPFNGDYTSSVFFSQDPVAIDSVGADFLMNEPTVTSRNSALRDNPNVENYLHEAALVADAPSGTTYYNGNGMKVNNLGVHEHWNNPTDKQYSRNLGGSEGIELVQVRPSQLSAGSTALPRTAFSDVPADAWYAKAVEDCRASGLMSGTGPTTFSPGATVSRGQLAAILYRQAGSPASETVSFTDVPAGAYYAGAAAWASEKGIIQGYTDGRFAPNSPITREQIAVILWRYAGSPHPPVVEPFADQAGIASHAIDAVAWARSEKILSGTSANLFRPKSPVTRGEAAVILSRFLLENGRG